MRALVTGGTGFIGGHLIDRLVSEGVSVRALVRKTSDTSRIKSLGVKLLVGDIRDKQTLSGALDDVDVAYHFGAIAGVKNLPDTVYRKTNVDGTQNMLELALDSDIKKFVHASTVGVIGWNDGETSDEETPCSPHGIYHKTKWEAEKLAFKHQQENGLPVTVVRPGITYGPRDTTTFVHRLARLLKKRLFAYIGGGLTLMHFGHIQNLIDGVLLTAENEKSVGEAYILVDDSPFRFRQLVQTICSVLDVPEPKIHIPTPLAYLVGYCMEPMALLGIEPPVTRYRIDLLTKTVSYSIEKARRQLGYNPQIKTLEGIRSTIPWYIENNLL